MPEPEPAPLLKDQAPAGQPVLDAAALAQLRRAEALRLWQNVLAKRRAGHSQQARESYVLYLRAAYRANENRWLLLELGRTLEQLGEAEGALKEYRRYLVGTSVQKENPADRREAERAADRLEYKLRKELPVRVGRPPLGGLTTAGIVTLSVGSGLLGLSLALFLTDPPRATPCNRFLSPNCLPDLSREIWQAGATLFSVLGGGAAVTGLILFGAGISKRISSSASRAAAVSLAPNISPYTIGLLATGRF